MNEQTAAADQPHDFELHIEISPTGRDIERCALCGRLRESEIHAQQH